MAWVADKFSSWSSLSPAMPQWWQSSKQRLGRLSPRYFWDPPLQVGSPDNREYLVGIYAAGITRTPPPFKGNATLTAWAGLPWHLVACKRGRGWRVEVTDLTGFHTNMSRWRPRPFIFIASCSPRKQEAQAEAAGIADLIRDGGATWIGS